MKNLLLALILVGIACFVPDPTFAVDVPADLGLSDTARSAELQTKDDIPTLVGSIIGTALSMIGVIFFILMIYGGFIWMTAHGESSRVDKARDTIFAAIMGVIIVIGSYAITQFVFDSTSADNPVQADVQEAVDEEVRIICVNRCEPLHEDLRTRAICVDQCIEEQRALFE